MKKRPCMVLQKRIRLTPFLIEWNVNRMVNRVLIYSLLNATNKWCLVTSSSAIMVYCSYSAILATWTIFFVDGCFLVLVYIECFCFGILVLKGTIVVTLRSFLTWGCSGWGLLSSSSFSATSLDMYRVIYIYCGVPSTECIEA